MKNEYGVLLDRNGYAPSVVLAYKDDACFLCDRMGDLVRHEIFHGPYRTKSKALGCWVLLCPDCHMQLHANADLDRQLRQIGQRLAMAWYDWTVDEFRERFGKNFEEEEQI